jgi:hypothetical protein
VINLDATGDVVDPEDWSPQRTQYLDELGPGDSATQNWIINTILEGDFMVYIVLIPEPESAETTSHPVTSGGIHLTVDPFTRLNPCGVLPFAIGGPILLLVITYFVYRRRPAESTWAVLHKLLLHNYLVRHLMKHYSFNFGLLVFARTAAFGLGPEHGNDKEDRAVEARAHRSDLSKVILTEKAAERLGIETVSASGMEVPYAAVIYDIEGNTWIYTMPEPLTFVREQIVIDNIEGDTVILAESLPSEFNVVTVGVAEIYGTETGVSK